MIDSIKYFVDSKKCFNFELKDQSWDVYISAFNNDERVHGIYEKIPSNKKYWLNLPEYGYHLQEIPNNCICLTNVYSNEADVVIDLLNQIAELRDSDSKVLIDITGLMRPHILFILKYLKSKQFKVIHMLYTEPLHYEKKDQTKFTLDDVYVVRQVAGYEGNHSTNMSNDILIVGVGYDHDLISRVILDKENANVVMLQSLPSLSADMYHESIIRLDKVSCNLVEDKIYFSSANDPYVTASVLSEAYLKLSAPKEITNFYLSPLATKPQTLGFGLFFINELEDKPASIIFPFSKTYAQKPSVGIGKSWLYPISFNN
ncbi:MAG: hypothetical protein Q8K07_02320 [Methylicorpusculum sp.]|uniref:hypothetical protein n=1 Tax=Methylicorpusculum sp. TaxID=2713644 RepID=UPI00273001AD|nr:hypothetical protein [Methylicorpusculum sp.]MDP2200827.1 hypothetical protein [Methylicorpusculum sp.]